MFSTSRSKGEQSTKAAAETATEQCTNRVDHQQHNEGEEIWNLMAAVWATINFLRNFVVIIEAKHPHAAHNNPHKQKARQETLYTTTTT